VQDAVEGACCSVEVLRAFGPDDGVDQAVDNGSAETFEAQMFAQLKRDATRPEDSGVPFGPRPYVGAAFTTPEDRYDKIDFEDLDDGTYRVEVDGGWAAVLQHYFVSAWVGNAGEVNAYYGRRLSDGNYAVGFVAPRFVHRQARDLGSDPDDELSLMITHGLLHLVGYDHESEPEADVMEERERSLLALVGVDRR
jgi:hypothetical protein